ncbi:hypothetical protein [Pseudomonas purpurea]|uniref:hypothetical protein n=1 Tax=Pseudomonas purpurea TaxID=3136737 RepID=UPI003264FBB3
MFIRNGLLCLTLSLPLGSALACGPDFPLRLLSDRAHTLAELPEGSFQFEASRLGSAIAGLKPATAATLGYGYYGDGDPYVQEKTKAEQVSLSDAQQTLVAQLRQLKDPQQALIQGASLPAELSLYSAGAVAFNAGEYQQATEYFRQVLALPADQRALRSTWAAYSLGRALYAISVQANDLDELARRDMLLLARKAFQQTRQLSVDGFSDPQELGISSLGEEARLLLEDGNWNGAIGLYATQSLHGSPVGLSSLKQLVAQLSAMPDAELAQLLEGKPVQQLVTAALISHMGWSYGEQPPSEQKLIKALILSTAASLENADRLAALNYQIGDYTTTQTLLEHAGDGGLAWWLRAKLALRAGDKAAAASAYAKAAKAFPQTESWGYRTDDNGYYETLKPGCRVEGESAVLALERGDYLQAFDQLYRSDDVYWQDTASIAERVLTLDELKQYVDSHVPAPPPTPKQESGYYTTLPIAAQLRELLGRRLLREGHYDQVSGYFDSPELQAKAKAYGQYRQDAESRWLPTARAEAYYQAAKLARESGMELLGYEMGPDFHALEGMYSLEIPPVEAGPFITAAEVQRQQATQAAPDVRYHYRYVAAQLANDSANFLPHSSQAFAAVLCKAARWTRGSDDELAYYQRYINQGPYVQWAENFGENCEEPTFDTANKRYVTQVVDAVRSALRPFKLALIAGASVLVLGAAFLLWNRRRAKR